MTTRCPPPPLPPFVIGEDSSLLRFGPQSRRKSDMTIVTITVLASLPAFSMAWDVPAAAPLPTGPPTSAPGGVTAAGPTFIPAAVTDAAVGVVDEAGAQVADMAKSVMIGSWPLGPKDVDLPLSDRVLIPAGYNKNVLPVRTDSGGNGSFVRVSAEFEPRYVCDLDSRLLTLTVLVNVDTKWIDDRIVINATEDDDSDTIYSIDATAQEHLWTPSLVATRLERMVPVKMLGDVQTMYVLADKTVGLWYTARIAVSCPEMDFAEFPVDVQVCDFNFEDMTKDSRIRLEGYLNRRSWKQRLNEFETELRPLNKGKGKEPMVGFQIVVSRQYQVHILRYYLPCIAIVLVSLVSFIVDPSVVPGRAGLLITVFLVIFTIFGDVQGDTPKSRGLTAMSHYILVCLLFVFGAIVEYAFILANLRRHKVGKRLLRPKADLSGRLKSLPRKSDKKITSLPADSDDKEDRLGAGAVDDYCYRVDKVALVVFSLAFFVYNVVYVIVHSEASI